MDVDLKEEIWKVFSVASFLFITIFFILPYLVQVSTYFHERGHQKALDKYGIENSYQVNLLDTIHNFYIVYRVTKLLGNPIINYLYSILMTTNCHIYQIF